MHITKKNGKIVVFDNEKIASSILKANAEAEGEEISKAKADILAEEVFNRVTEENEIITTRDVTRCVCRILREQDLTATAESYRKYSEEKNK